MNVGAGRGAAPTPAGAPPTAALPGAGVPPAGHAHVEGVSFAWGTRAAATLLILALAVLAWRNADHPLLARLSRDSTVYVLFALAIVAFGYCNVLFSRTRVDATQLRQGCWPLQRSVALADVSQVLLIRVRGLEWLVTPRLVVRSRSAGKTSFHCADARVRRALEQLAYGTPDDPTRPRA